MLSGTSGKNFQVFFLASVCPKEYKNGKIFDRQFFRPQEAISLTVPTYGRLSCQGTELQGGPRGDPPGQCGCAAAGD